MKLLEAVKSKKITGTILASALVVGSLGTITAFAANGSDAIPKNTVMTAPAAIDVAAAADKSPGTIEYNIDTYSRTDGKQNFTLEHWYDPQTKDFRSDLKDYSADHRLLRFQSTYYVNGGSEIVVIQRDGNGDPVSGKVLEQADDPSAFETLAQKNKGFSAVKENYKASYWTSVGTEQTPGGKTLNKVMDSYQSIIDGTPANMRYVVYLDQESGFPVKEELYADSTGTFKLFSTDATAYQYVSDDASIFDTDGVSLTPVKTSAEAYAE